MCSANVRVTHACVRTAARETAAGCIFIPIPKSIKRHTCYLRALIGDATNAAGRYDCFAAVQSAVSDKQC
jgi:hypothetical protein